MPSIVESTAAALRQAVDADNALNCFVEIDRDGALDAAAASHRRHIDRAALGPVDGLAVAIKDNIDVRGFPSRHGSRLFDDDPPAAADAPLAAALRSAGAVIIGKTHMTELACGTTSLNPHGGPARNPRNLDHHAGGSSSGSAVAVASGAVPVAVGSDTGGSIRIPAAACGVVGFKPTYGAISTAGVGIGAKALDHVGPIAATTRLAADAFSAMRPPNSPSQRARDHVVSPVTRVGVLVGPFLSQCDPGVLAAFSTALATFENMGIALAEVDLGIDLGAMDEQANLLGRDLFDWIAPRMAVDKASTVGEELASWLTLYDAVSDADIAGALEERQRVIEKVDASLSDADVEIIVCPTLRIGAGRLDEAADEPRWDRCGNVTLFNMTGQPSLTLPCGRASNGMPAGLLINGRRNDDHAVLAFGMRFEAAHSAWRPNTGFAPPEVTTAVTL